MTAPTIFTLDDDPIALRMLGAMLRQEGFLTLPAASLAEARRVLAGNRPDLAILDVHLPDGSGLDLCRELAAGDHHDLPVLVVSADDQTATKVAGFAAGAVDYITKPFNRAETMARVRTHLRLRAALRAAGELQAMKLAQIGHEQRVLLPRPESIPAANFALAYHPLQEAGGDFCQVMELSPSVHDYTVLDVCGHQVGVAMTTAAADALLRANASLYTAPQDVLRNLDQVLRGMLSAGRFLTAVYARLNRLTNRLTLVTAGHPPSLLHRRDGTVEILQLPGDVIGAFDHPEFGVRELTVAPGDRIFLFSDAVVDGLSGGDERTDWTLGSEQAAALLSYIPRGELAAAVDALAKAAMPDGRQSDDIVVLGIAV